MSGKSAYPAAINAAPAKSRPEDAREGPLSAGLRSRLEVARARVVPPCGREHTERAQCRDEEDPEAEPIPAVEGKDGGDGERAEHRPGLIHRLVQPEAPAVTDFFGRVREHRITGGRADRLAHSLGDHQSRGELPTADEREERDGKEIQAVAEERDRPVSPRPVGEVA